MKKKSIIVTIIVIATLAIGGAIAFMSPGSKTFTAYDACQLFTEAEAKQLLGKAATKREENPTSTKHIKETACTYGNNAEAVRNLRVATVVVHSPLTEYGRDTNDDVFGPGQRPPAAQTVSGYGEDAYYNPATGQFQILKDGNWITLTNGPIPTDRRTLEDAKKLADMLFN